MKKQFVAYSLLILVCLMGTASGTITSLQDAKIQFAKLYPNVFPPQDIFKTQVGNAYTKWGTYFEDLRAWMENDFFKKTYGLLKQPISKSNQDGLIVAVDMLNKDGGDLLREMRNLAQWKRPAIEQQDVSQLTAIDLIGPGSPLRVKLASFATAGVKQDEVPSAIETVARIEILLASEAVSKWQSSHTQELKNNLSLVKEQIKKLVHATDRDKALTGQAWGKKMINYLGPVVNFEAALQKILQSFERTMAQLKKDLATYSSDFAETKELKTFLMLIATELGKAILRVKNDAQALKG